MLTKSALNKFFIFVCSISFLYLSYVNIASGLKEQIDIDSVSGYGLQMGYVVFIISFFLFSLGNTIRKINWPLLLLASYIFILFLFQQVSLVSALSGIGLLLWLFSYSMGNRVASCSEEIIEYFENILFIITSILTIYVLFFYFNKGFVSYQMTTDTSFFLIVYLPFLMLYNKKRFIKIVIVFLFIIVCVLSLKRSIVVGLFVFFVFFIALSIKKETTHRWYFWLIPVLVIIVAFVLKNSIGEVLALRFSETAETGGNGRIEIYTNIIHHYIDSNFTEQIFGHGYRSVRYINNGLLAHNDFLQLLYDGGVLGVLLYMALWFFFIRIAIKNWRRRKQFGNVFSVYISTLALYFTLSMMNCFIYSYMLMSPLMLAIGFLFGIIRNNKTIVVM